PEQVGHQADEAGLGELVGVAAHGVVDAPNLHDGDDRAGGRLVGNSEIGAHLAVAELYSDGLGLHAGLSSLSSSRALPAKIIAFRPAVMGSASIALMVLRIRPRPSSASNGASVANKHDDVPKNACPQRVAAGSPLSAVSA